MNISIIGLGYVGVVCSACFAKEGHNIIGVDIDKNKVELINSKKSPIIEKDLDELIKSGVESKKLKAVSNTTEAILQSEISIICVGTPSKENGDIDLKYIKSAAQEIATALKQKNSFHIVSMRSTVMPGTGENIVIPTIEKFSGKKLGLDFGYISNPEFLRESSAIYDFYNPPKTVIGYSDEKSRDIFKSLYSFLSAPLFTTDIKVAEMIKYADNSWHATKVTFANEIGLISKELGIDSHKVMDIFCADRKLNISTYYLKPGFAFGGSCLPKDVRAINHKAKSLDLDTKLLNSLLLSNNYQIERVFDRLIKPLKSRKIAIAGISFKADTDDLRESPMLKLAELLIGKGYLVNIYDKNISQSKQNPSNKYFLENDLWHINQRLKDSLDLALKDRDIIIIGNKDQEFTDIPKKYADKHIVDLVRVSKNMTNKNYTGIAW